MPVVVREKKPRESPGFKVPAVLIILCTVSILGFQKREKREIRMPGKTRKVKGKSTKE